MADTKYGQYVKSLSFREDRPGFFRQRTTMNGEFLGLDAHIEYGTYWSSGKIGAEPYEPHVHDFDQVMLWLGTDTDNMGELGAEVELYLGEEEDRVKHMITTTTAVALPKGYPHFPATITRMDKRFILLVVSCAPEYRETPVPADKEVLEKTLVAAFMANRNKVINVAFARKGAWFYGPGNRDDHGGALAIIPFRDVGFDFLMMCDSIKKAPYRFGAAPDKSHAHPYPEILLFMGADTNDLNELGAEVEVFLGKEKERHVFTTPTAVICPRGFLHGGTTIMKLYKPFFFLVIRPFGASDINIT